MLLGIRYHLLYIFWWDLRMNYSNFLNRSLYTQQFIFALFVKPLDAPLWLFYLLCYIGKSISNVYFPFRSVRACSTGQQSNYRIVSMVFFRHKYAFCKFDFLYFCRRAMHFNIVLCAIVVMIDYILFSDIQYHVIFDL